MGKDDIGKMCGSDKVEILYLKRYFYLKHFGGAPHTGFRVRFTDSGKVESLIYFQENIGRLQLEQVKECHMCLKLPQVSYK